MYICIDVYIYKEREKEREKKIIQDTFMKNYSKIEEYVCTIFQLIETRFFKSFSKRTRSNRSII